MTVHHDVSWKPKGRGRHFDRMRRGLARRLRLPIVRFVKWEQAHPNATTTGLPREVSYGPPWTSDHSLANFSFACKCHKRVRYNRRRGR